MCKELGGNSGGGLSSLPSCNAFYFTHTGITQIPLKRMF